MGHAGALQCSGQSTLSSTGHGIKLQAFASSETMHFSPSELERRLNFFLPEDRLAAAHADPGGNINQTWILRLARGQRAVLQRLSPVVFPDLRALMANFRTVTAHLAACRQHDPVIPEFPQAYRNPAGLDALDEADGSTWRLISYIGPSRTLMQVNARQAAAAGRMLARFHKLLLPLGRQKLADPLPGFHDTAAYLARFDAVSRGKTPASQEEECCFAGIDRLRPLARLLESGVHARHLVHGDPKCGNFLFAQNADAVLSLIDLDTVRLDYVLHDLGDCLRSCCNVGGEDAETPCFDAENFAALVQAYGAGGREILTQDDRALLVDATRLLIFELGLRFFTDHLDGNRYFQCRFPGHNLKRAVTQFKLHAALMQDESRLRTLAI